MNTAQLEPFLLSGMTISLIMAVISAFRRKSRGIGAFIMSAAFVVLGLGMLLVYLRASEPLLLTCGIILVLLLGADFAARSAHAHQESEK